MKIGILTLSFWPRVGGMEYVVHGLATALQRAGNEVHVFAPSFYPTDATIEIEHIYSLHRFGWTFRGAFHSGINRISLIRKFFSLNKDKKFNVLNVHSAHTATRYALDLKALFGIPIVVTCHGHDIQRIPEIGYGYRLDPREDRRIRKHLTKADRSISISDSVYAELKSILDEKYISKVPNGIDEEFLTSSASKIIKGRIADQNAKIILSVGRNVKKKAFDVGLRAFASIPDTLNCHYVHVGADGKALENLAKELKVCSRFHQLGVIPRKLIPSLYKEADIFFSPAAVEAFPLVSLEALASGLPCVVTDGPGNRDSVEHGVDGLIVKVGDTSEMKNALLTLLNDDDLRASFGDKARKKIDKHYRWEVVAKEYLEVFCSLKN